MQELLPACQLHLVLKLFLLFEDALQIRMPSLSPTMQEGTIVKWHKKEGNATVILYLFHLCELGFLFSFVFLLNCYLFTCLLSYIIKVCNFQGILLCLVIYSVKFRLTKLSLVLK